MDVGRAFSAFRQDPLWKGKIALAILLYLVPVLNLAVTGWGIRYVQNVSKGKSEELPSWNEFGSHWMRGFVFGLARTVYYIPAILIIILSGVPGAIAVGASNGSIESMFATLESVLAGTLVALLYGLAVSVLTQAARAHYAEHDSLGAAFDVRGILAAVKSNTSGYFTAWLVATIAIWLVGLVSFFLASVLNVVPCIGPFLSFMALPLFVGLGLYVGMGANGLFGQYARQAYATSPGFGSSIPPVQPSNQASLLAGAPAPAQQRLTEASGAVATEAPASASAQPGSSQTIDTMSMDDRGRAAIAEALARMRTEQPVGSDPVVFGVDDPAASSARSDAAHSGIVSAPQFPGDAETQEARVTQPVSEPRPLDEPVTSAADGPTETADVDAVATVSADEVISRTASRDQDADLQMPTIESATGTGFDRGIEEDAKLELEASGLTGAECDEAKEIDFIEAVVTDQAGLAEIPVQAHPDTHASLTTSLSAYADCVAESDAESRHQDPQLPEDIPPPGSQEAGTEVDSAIAAESSISTARPADKTSQYQLTAISGSGSPGTWVLPSSEVRVGRSEDCFIRIDDDKISREHALVYASGDGLLLRDAGSTNGTFHNGSPLGAESVELRRGDVVQMGDTQFEVGEA